jgi:hypothetical protein
MRPIGDVRSTSQSQAVHDLRLYQKQSGLLVAATMMSFIVNYIDRVFS